jgi:hypothetical protein
MKSLAARFEASAARAQMRSRRGRCLEGDGMGPIIATDHYRHADQNQNLYHRGHRGSRGRALSRV